MAETVNQLTEELVNLEMGNQKPDPLVQLKQQELDMRAMDIQRKSQEFAVEEQRKREEFEQTIDLDRMQREDSEAASKERIRVADEKLDVMREKMGVDKKEGEK